MTPHHALWLVALAVGTAHIESRGWIDQRQDPETGLTYLHARYYDAALGQFVSPDPLNPIEPGVGANRYRYALSDPINASDRGGLDADPYQNSPLECSDLDDCGATLASMYYYMFMATGEISYLNAAIAALDASSYPSFTDEVTVEYSDGSTEVVTTIAADPGLNHVENSMPSPQPVNSIQNEQRPSPAQGSAAVRDAWCRANPVGCEQLYEFEHPFLPRRRHDTAKN